jgi:large subunit ribosomal protein L9
MKVILLKDVEKIGKEGQVKEVKDGFARNYLIPNGAALSAAAKNLKQAEEIKRKRLKIVQELKKNYLVLKDKIENLSLTVSAEAKEDEELYGSISEAQIIKLLKDEEIEMQKGQIIINEPIKKIGVYHLTVNLYDDIQAKLKLWVVKK